MSMGDEREKLCERPPSKRRRSDEDAAHPLAPIQAVEVHNTLNFPATPGGVVLADIDAAAIAARPFCMARPTNSEHF